MNSLKLQFETNEDQYSTKWKSETKYEFDITSYWKGEHGKIKQKKTHSPSFCCQTRLTFLISFHLGLNYPANQRRHGFRQELDLTGTLQQITTHYANDED